MQKIHFILVEPAVPENVGASARAIKTMGFHSLRLVNPCEFESGKAQWLAHASTEILNNAKVYNSLKDAIVDMDYVIGSSAKARSAKGDHHTAETIPTIISEKKNSISNIAIVFGREESGLTNEELQLCDISTFISMQTTYPSLNLSQAVMLYAYLLAGLNNISPDKRDKACLVSTKKGLGSTPEKKFVTLKKELAQLLSDTKISSNPNIYNRIFERLALLGDNDINLVLSILAALKEKGK
jgi:tRNA/rRNA methyltransferase